jgi:hypothetical protein
MLGAKAYRDYFHDKLGGSSAFISIYIQMEMRRSFLRNVISFYSTLELPRISTIGDAVALWSDKFKSSESKAVLQLISALLGDTNALDSSSSADKNKALTVLGQFIVRFEAKLRTTFTDASKDTTHCARALVPLPFYPEQMSRGFQEFIAGFDDTDTCRSKCTIDNVILRRYKKEVDDYIATAKTLKRSVATSGFLDITEQLNDIVKKGPAACSCNRCVKIGDAVIALDAPREMRLEHVDRSFNELCDLIHQPHKQHPSQSVVLKRPAEIS